MYNINASISFYQNPVRSLQRSTGNNCNVCEIKKREW